MFVPVGTYDFVITSDIGCAGFDVLVEDISGTIKEITLPTGGKTIFHTTTRYTRTDTDVSSRLPASAPGDPTAPTT